MDAPAGGNQRKWSNDHVGAPAARQHKVFSDPGDGLVFLPCPWRQPLSKQIHLTIPRHTPFAESALAFSILLRLRGLRRQQS